MHYVTLQNASAILGDDFILSSVHRLNIARKETITLENPRCVVVDAIYRQVLEE